MAMSLQQVQHQDKVRAAMRQAIREIKPRLRKGLYHIWHCTNAEQTVRVPIQSDPFDDQFTQRREIKMTVPAKEGQGYGPARAYDAWRRNLIENLRSPA
ncbi:MAG: hypothetical protein ACKOX6_00800 [Bdellovibrio sp.]